MRNVAMGSSTEAAAASTTAVHAGGSARNWPTSMIEVAGGQRVHSVFFHHNINPYPRIHESQLVIHSPAEITFRLSPSSALSAAEKGELEAKFRRELGEGCAFQIELTDQLERNRTGKVEQVIYREQSGEK